MPEFRRVCLVGDVQEGRGRPITVDGLTIAVLRDRGLFYALLNRCPHQNGSIGDGRIEDGEAICPDHDWRFKLTTGRCTNVRGNTLHTFAVELRGEEVWVAV